MAFAKLLDLDGAVNMYQSKKRQLVAHVNAAEAAAHLENVAVDQLPLSSRNSTSAFTGASLSCGTAGYHALVLAQTQTDINAIVSDLVSRGVPMLEGGAKKVTSCVYTLQRLCEDVATRSSGTLQDNDEAASSSFSDLGGMELVLLEAEDIQRRVLLDCSHAEAAVNRLRKVAVGTPVGTRALQSVREALERPVPRGPLLGKLGSA